MTADELRAELRDVQATIDAAYWRFTRCASAPPPVLVVPEAYERRAEIKRALRALRHDLPKNEKETDHA